MSIEAKVERFILDEILMDSKATLDPNESLLGRGVLDSLALLRLIRYLETEFGVTIEDGEVVPDNFDSLASMKAFMEQKLSTST